MAISATNDATRALFTDWITSQIGDDPDLRAKVIPDYPATGKRTLQDNGSWLRTLTLENVELVRTGIERIERDAVVTVDGERYEADVIVYATGFQATKALYPMEIVGRHGTDCERCGGSDQRRTSVLLSQTFRTSSACTAQGPTWPTAAV